MNDMETARMRATRDSDVRKRWQRALIGLDIERSSIRADDREKEYTASGLATIGHCIARKLTVLMFPRIIKTYRSYAFTNTNKQYFRGVRPCSATRPRFFLSRLVAFSPNPVPVRYGLCPSTRIHLRFCPVVAHGLSAGPAVGNPMRGVRAVPVSVPVQAHREQRPAHAPGAVCSHVSLLIVQKIKPGGVRARGRPRRPAAAAALPEMQSPARRGTMPGLAGPSRVAVPVSETAPAARQDRGMHGQIGRREPVEHGRRHVPGSRLIPMTPLQDGWRTPASWHAFSRICEPDISDIRLRSDRLQDFSGKTKTGLER